MGASRVEVVHDLRAASLRWEQYDAILNEGETLPRSLYEFSKSEKGGKVVCTNAIWVWDCLVTGTFRDRRYPLATP
jgi:hypothetical protein